MIRESDVSTAERSRIAAELRRYLADEISLDDLGEWLVFNAWDIHKRGDAVAAELAHAIEHEIAAISEVLRTEREAKVRLTQLVVLSPTSEARRETP